LKRQGLASAKVARQVRDLLLALKERHWYKEHYGCIIFDPLPKQAKWMSSKAKESVISGGNRSGKTEAAAANMALEALGIKGLIFPGFKSDGMPGSYWAVALSGALLNDPIIPKLRKMLGPKARYRVADGIFIAPNGSNITLKSQEAEIEKFQAVSLDGIWIDEVGKSKGHYDEMRARLVDRSGWIKTSMTPTKGVDWMFKIWKRWHRDTLGDEREANDTLFVFLDTERNPHLPFEGFVELLRSIDSEEKERMRLRGQFVELRGLVFPNFDYDRHVIRCLKNGKCTVETPPHWRRARAYDFGLAAPSTCLWFAEDPREKEVVVYRELYDRSRSTARDVAMEIVRRSGKEAFEIDILDPACFRQEPFKDAAGRWHRVADEYSNAGIPVLPGNNDILGGFDKVTQLLGRSNETPRLRFHECCPETIRETEEIHWKQGVIEGTAAHERTGGDDHAVDALRYFANWYWEVTGDLGEEWDRRTSPTEAFNPTDPDAPEEAPRPRIKTIINPDGTYSYQTVFTRGKTDAEEWEEADSLDWDSF